MNRRDHETEIPSHLSSKRLDALQKRASLRLVHQGYELVAQIQGDEIDRLDLHPRFRFRRLRVVLMDFFCFRARRAVSEESRDSTQEQEGYVGQPRDHGKDHKNHARKVQHGRVAEELFLNRGREVSFGRSATDHDAGGGGYEQGGDLRDEAIPYREKRVGLRRFPDGHALLEYPHGQAPQDVHSGDDDPCDRVSADELARTVHGSVEVCLFGNPFPSLPCLCLPDQACIQICINAHLFAGHGIQRKAGRHFCNSTGPFRNDHEVDHHENHEHHEPHHILPAHHELAEGCDHLSCRLRALFPAQQDESRGGDVQR